MFSFDTEFSLDTLVQVASLLVVVVTFLWAQRRESHRQQEVAAAERERDREIANREIYQRLELASIDLFRFEADHVNLIRPLWETDATLPGEGTAEYTVLMNYVCQILNLFEMAVRFRREDIVPHEVFGSWVIWIYDLCRMPAFAVIWQHNRTDYTCELRAIMDAGTRIASEGGMDADAGRQAFFDTVSRQIGGCPEVRDWLTKCDEEAAAERHEDRQR